MPGTAFCGNAARLRALDWSQSQPAPARRFAKPRLLRKEPFPPNSGIMPPGMIRRTNV